MESNIQGNKILARDSCSETVGSSRNWTGFYDKDWKNLSTNGFGSSSGKTTGEMAEEEEEGKVKLPGSVGNFKSSGDKGWSQSNPLSSESNSSCSSKESGRLFEN